MIVIIFFNKYKPTPVPSGCVLPTREEKYFWVRTLEPSKEDSEDRSMPFIPEAEQILGVIHIDGNGLGMALRALQKGKRSLKP